MVQAQRDSRPEAEQAQRDDPPDPEDGQRDTGPGPAEAQRDARPAGNTADVRAGPAGTQRDAEPEAEEAPGSGRSGPAAHSRAALEVITAITFAVAIVGSIADLYSLAQVDGRLLLSFAGGGTIALFISLTIRRYSATRKGAAMVGAIIVLALAGAAVLEGLRGEDRPPKPATLPGKRPTPSPAVSPARPPTPRAVNTAPGGGLLTVAPYPMNGTPTKDHPIAATNTGGAATPGDPALPGHSTAVATPPPTTPVVTTGPTAPPPPPPTTAGPSGPAEPPPSLKVTFPLSGDRMEHLAAAEGTIVSAVGDREIWALTQAGNGAAFYPQGPCTSDGQRWGCSSVPYKGGEVVQACLLRMVVVEAAAAGKLAAGRDRGFSEEVLPDLVSYTDVDVKC
ncbi:hypothetical protein ACIA5D_09410 [Actinoplanes sp. NPDC051513]|uniref:hypothetical protein n=1 Tax=Actinoplanes sp. NPDC051513 TaxID=3363908 RepID=UPI0037B74B58